MQRLPRFLWTMSAVAASYALGVCIYTQALRRPAARGLLRARPRAREPAPYELTASLARQAMFGSSR